MSLIMKDQAKTQWPKEPVWIDDQPKGESIIVRLAVAIVLTLAIATVYAVSGSDALGDMPKTSAYQHAISPEMRSYLSGPGKGLFIKDGDIE